MQHWVDEVALFGSMLDPDPTHVGDIDVAVRITTRYEGAELERRWWDGLGRPPTGPPVQQHRRRTGLASDSAATFLRDERVEADGYNEQDLCDVAVQLEQSAILFVGLLDRLSQSEWALNVAYAFPEKSMRSLRWVAVHTAHGVVHHLHDVRSST